jgi:biotin--protein ligase
MPEVKIKWPNDLYAKGLKIGGVLCTSTYSSKNFNVVIGVGLNVANQHPTICLDTLLHEICSDPTTLTRHELLAAILGRFEVLFKVFLSQGGQPFLSDVPCHLTKLTSLDDQAACKGFGAMR